MNSYAESKSQPPRPTTNLKIWMDQVKDSYTEEEMANAISLFRECLDEDGQISTAFLHRNSYHVMLFPGDVENIHVELFCRAHITQEYLDVKTAFKPENVECKSIARNRINLYIYLHNSVNWTIISDEARTGFFFKEPMGEYYLVFGTLEFMARFYPVSHEIAEEDMSMWIFSSNDLRKEFFRSLEAKYLKFRYKNEK